MSYQPATPPGGPPQKRLTRSVDDRMIAGVCGGLARYTGVDATVIRLLVVAGTLLGFGSVGIVYLVAWALMPQQ